MVQGVEDIAAGEQQLLHGQHDLRRAAGDGACTRVHPACFSIVTLGDGFELQFIRFGGMEQRDSKKEGSQ